MSELDGKKYNGKITKLAEKYNKLMLEKEKEDVEYVIVPSKDKEELER